ncbi:MAG: LLM class flavin-dependent oxidoreductase [Rhodospirillales bacterium]|jgi:alkanesulfonate monooxygenase SsuD/methylene tetrahydromethanopterin reductase-like flavin-dependent oxidoreductase (luciferase family)|nr:LLM class flavin-dependent oxidoreductase [Rhodospirillales bacterium]
MKFMFFSENDTQPGETHERRYWDLVDQVLAAEKWGFDLFGVSEQLFSIGGATTSSPEVLYAYLFPLTSRLRFRHAITLLPKNINHPLRVASRTAVQDILSHGRIELGTGRGNTTLALRAFEVDPKTNKSEWAEGMEVLVKAFTEDPFMHYGEHYKIPPRSLVPKTIQKPYPPLSSAATSVESHAVCGGMGMGIMSWSSYLGWEEVKTNLAAFDKGQAEARAAGKHINETRGVLVQAYCSETDAKAKEEAGEGNVAWLKLAIDGYPKLAKLSKDYAYMSKINDVADKYDDFDYFLNESGGAVFGSPETCIKQIEQFREIGFNEVILRMDSTSHQNIMKSVELFGRYVIPHFKYPENVVEPASEVVARMKMLRNKARADGVYETLKEVS